MMRPVWDSLVPRIRSLQCPCGRRPHTPVPTRAVFLPSLVTLLTCHWSSGWGRCMPRSQFWTSLQRQEARTLHVGDSGARIKHISWRFCSSPAASAPRFSFLSGSFFHPLAQHTVPDNLTRDSLVLEEGPSALTAVACSGHRALSGHRPTATAARFRLGRNTVPCRGGPRGSAGPHNVPRRTKLLGDRTLLLHVTGGAAFWNPK